MVTAVSYTPSTLTNDEQKKFRQLLKDRINDNTDTNDYFEFERSESPDFNRTQYQDARHALQVFLVSDLKYNQEQMDLALEKFDQLLEPTDGTAIPSRRGSEEKVGLNMQEVVDAGKDEASVENGNAEEADHDESANEDNEGSHNGSNSGSSSDKSFKNFIKEYCKFFNEMQEMQLKQQQQQDALEDQRACQAFFRQVLMSMMTGNTGMMPGITGVNSNPWATSSTSDFGAMTLGLTYRAGMLAQGGNFAVPSVSSPFVGSTTATMPQFTDPMALLNQYMMSRFFERMFNSSSSKGRSHDSDSNSRNGSSSNRRHNSHDSNNRENSANNAEKPTNFRWRKPKVAKNEESGSVERSDGLQASAGFNGNLNQPYAEIQAKGKNGKPDQTFRAYVDADGNAQTNLDGRPLSRYDKLVNNDDFMIALDDEFKNNFENWYNLSGKHLDVDEIWEIVQRKGIKNIEYQDVQEFVRRGSKASLDNNGAQEEKQITDKDFQAIKQYRGGNLVAPSGGPEAPEPGKVSVGRDGDSPVSMARGQDGTLVQARLNGDGVPYDIVQKSPDANAYERIMQQKEYRPLLAAMKAELERRKDDANLRLATLGVTEVMSLAESQGIKLNSKDAKTLTDALSTVVKGDYCRLVGTDAGRVTIRDMEQALKERHIVFDGEELKQKGWGDATEAGPTPPIAR